MKTKGAIQLIKGQEKYAEIIFSVAIILELVVMMTDHFASWTLPYRGRVTHVAFVLLCIKILFTKYNYRQAVIIILAGVLGTISYLTCRDEYVIRAVVFVAAAVGINMHRNLRIILYGTVIGTLLIILLALLGVCGEVVDIRNYGRGMIEARYCLGFNHANNVHCLLWYIISLFLLIRKRLSIYAIIVLFGLNVFLYYLTFSRTGVISVAVVLLGIGAVQYFGRIINRTVLLIISFIELVTALVLTMYAAIYLAIRLPIIKYVDRLLTGRLEMVSERAYIQLWKMFPAYRPSPEVDNAFAGITYSYGIIVGICLIGVIVYCAFRKYMQNDGVAMIILASVIGMLFMESTFIFNISLLCNLLLILLWRDDDHVDIKDTGAI